MVHRPYIYSIYMRMRTRACVCLCECVVVCTLRGLGGRGCGRLRRAPHPPPPHPPPPTPAVLPTCLAQVRAILRARESRLGARCRTRWARHTRGLPRAGAPTLTCSTHIFVAFTCPCTYLDPTPRVHVRCACTAVHPARVCGPRCVTRCVACGSPRSLWREPSSSNGCRSEHSHDLPPIAL